MVRRASKVARNIAVFDALMIMVGLNDGQQHLLSNPVNLKETAVKKPDKRAEV